MEAGMEASRGDASTAVDAPAPADGFRWVRAPWGWRLEAERLAAFCRHGWTTRALTLGAGEDGAGWDRVSAALGVDPHRLHRLRQVHGTAVHIATGMRSVPLPEADIALASNPAQAVAVQVADCTAILIVDRRTGAVAAAHAGWRGTAAGVAGRAVRAMCEAVGSDPADLSAALGPSIGPCCYVVGAELTSAFQDADDAEPWFAHREGRLFLDLWRANADQLRRAGIPPDEISVSRLCTSCHPGWFYSYRRDGAGTGRLAGYIRPAEGNGQGAA